MVAPGLHRRHGELQKSGIDLGRSRRPCRSSFNLRRRGAALLTSINEKGARAAPCRCMPEPFVAKVRAVSACSAHHHRRHAAARRRELMQAVGGDRGRAHRLRKGGRHIRAPTNAQQCASDGCSSRSAAAIPLSCILNSFVRPLKRFERTGIKNSLLSATFAVRAIRRRVAQWRRRIPRGRGLRRSSSPAAPPRSA